MRGIILAGGTGSRLHPITLGISKQLVPVYDKPMIYYPLTTLIHAGIREVLVINTAHEAEGFRQLLGDGSRFGISISYKVQPSPDGLAQAFTLGADFIGDQQVALVLGDNIFHGGAIREELIRQNSRQGGTIFGYWVRDPRAYGVVELDEAGQPLAIEEKPAVPRSHWAIPGLYFFDSRVVEIAADLTPSARGELEIVDVMRDYLHRGELRVSLLPKGTAWLDTGTFDSLNDASNFVRTLQARQGLQIGCPEVAAWENGFLSDDELRTLAEPMLKSGYGSYLLDLLT